MDSESGGLLTLTLKMHGGSVGVGSRNPTLIINVRGGFRARRISHVKEIVPKWGPFWDATIAKTLAEQTVSGKFRFDEGSIPGSTLAFRFPKTN